MRLRLVLALELPSGLVFLELLVRLLARIEQAAMSLWLALSKALLLART